MASKNKVTLGKADFIKRLAKNAKITKNDAESAYDLFVLTLRTAIEEGNDVRLNGIGTLKVTSYKERFYISPFSEKPITKPSGKRLNFTPSNSIKDSLNNGKTND